MATIMRFAGRALATSMFFVMAALVPAQQEGAFDGNWQMDAAKSHVNDGRVVSIQIATANSATKVTIKAQKKDGKETISEFTTKFDGKACEWDEGGHKSQVMTWYNGPTLNFSKEHGPADDVTSMWKFELSADKQTLTATINHYEPAADDETLVFTKKAS